MTNPDQIASTFVLDDEGETIYADEEEAYYFFAYELDSDLYNDWGTIAGDDSFGTINDAENYLFWDEGISRALRQVLNVKGPCGTSGTMNGEDYKEVYDKYWAYNYTDFNVIEFDVDFSMTKDSDGSNGSSQDIAYLIIETLMT